MFPTVKYFLITLVSYFEQYSINIWSENICEKHFLRAPNRVKRTKMKSNYCIVCSLIRSLRNFSHLQANRISFALWSVVDIIDLIARNCSRKNGVCQLVWFLCLAQVQSQIWNFPRISDHTGRILQYFYSVMVQTSCAGPRTETLNATQITWCALHLWFSCRHHWFNRHTQQS